MSYNMLIAEDELEEYELVVYLLKKIQLDSYFKIYHALNGKQALQILEDVSIDLILTDIKMPFANGLEVASAARQKNVELPIIFFTCYDDFSYVKTALTIQAYNYLLKPLDPEEFKKTMIRTLDFLRKAAIEKKNTENQSLITKNHYLYMKLNRMPYVHLNSMEENLRFESLKNYSQLLMLHFEESFFDCDSSLSNQFMDILHQMLPLPFDQINLNPSQSVLLLIGNNQLSITEMIKICQNIHEQLYELFHEKCYFGISSPLNDSYELADAYEDTCALLETRFFCQDRFVFYKQSVDGVLPDIQDVCTHILAEIESDIDSNNLSKLALDIQTLNQIFEQQKNYSHIFVRYIYSNLIQLLYKNQKQFTSDIVNDINEIFSCSFIYDIEKIVANVLSKLQMSSAPSNLTQNHVIQIVQQYISQHYSEPITLNELAGIVYLNPSYLSSLFKLKTGNSINKYIKSIRMEKARQMVLDTNMKVNDIGTAVGFNNTSYFIKSFHEYYGETPDKMRQ
ncbi:MAG: response regulator [Clostridiales bacterium]|nr:response regulator [Clostridiales bacterium]